MQGMRKEAASGNVRSSGAGAMLPASASMAAGDLSPSEDAEGRPRPVVQGGVAMDQPPLLFGHDGGRRREDPDTRVARGLRLLASTMRYIADDVDDTAYGPSLVRQASRLEARATEHESVNEYPVLRLV